MQKPVPLKFVFDLCSCNKHGKWLAQDKLHLLIILPQSFIRHYLLDITNIHTTVLDIYLLLFYFAKNVK